MNPDTDATEMIKLMCSWTFIISFGLMLCTIAQGDRDPDKMHWNRSGSYRVADITALTEVERSALLRPRPLYSRIIDGRTEWRYRIDDEWVYPTAEAVARAKI